MGVMPTGLQAAAPAAAAKPRLVLLEHDARFGVFSEFVPYDFAQPVRLPGMFACPSFLSGARGVVKPTTPIGFGKLGGAENLYLAELKGTATRIICDPPFLSDDCQTKGMSLSILPYPFGRSDELTGRNSRTYGPLVKPCVLVCPPYRLYWRANVRSRHKTLSLLWLADNDLRSSSRSGTQQRVLLLCQL